MSNKKKWYQTGEFEDGYQFGDIFRTIGNAISGDKEKSDTNKSRKNSGNKKETEAKKSQNSNLTLVGVKDGKLTFDPAAQAHGFSSEAERKRYQQQNPNLYAVTGGYKYEPSVLSKNYTPLTDEGEKIVERAREKDAYLGSIQYKIDKEDADRAQQKRLSGHNLTDREIEAELKIDWANSFATNQELAEQIKKQKVLNTAITKFKNGEALTLSEKLMLSENGGQNYTNGNINKTIDFLALDNPERISAKKAAEKAIEKEERGIPLTEDEMQDIAHYGDREFLRKAIVEDSVKLSSDIKQNTEKLNTFMASKLYNDAVYETGIDKTIAQMELYTTTGMSKYLQDTINTGTILTTEIAYLLGDSDKRASDVIGDIPKNEYEIANAAVAEYFTKNNKKFSKFVQDTTVNLANNAIPMMLGGISGGASMVATGLSVFGGSYSEAVALAPDANEWQYWLYAGINTASELYMEKLLGGDKNVLTNSGSEFGEAMFKSLTKNISNKALLKGAYVVSNATGEAIEGSLQGLLAPVMQELVLGFDTTSILSLNRKEQLSAMNNAMYDGLIGFASAGITTGLLGGTTAENLKQKQTVGAYYNKVFNDLNIDVNNVAVYLKEISKGHGSELYNAAESVINGDNSDTAIADMMLYGFEQSREAQQFVYTKIGERLTQSRPNIAKELIRQYKTYTEHNINFSESIDNTYNALANVDENTSNNTFNYLIGKLSATMDATLPRVSVISELTKIVCHDGRDVINKDVNNTKVEPKRTINTDEFIEGLWWENRKRADKSSDIANVENWDIESVENTSESGIMKSIPLSRYVNSSDTLYISSSKIKPISNFEDMVIHGDAFGFQINDKDGRPIANYTAIQFAKILKEDPNYHGGNIRLISCESGSVEFGAAQILANELGVEVLAPTDIVWVTIDGEMIVGPSEFENTGEWKIFKPKRRK